MSEVNEKFELMKLDPNNLAELDQWESKLKVLVDENPFIEVIDKESFTEAKKRRTNLKSGRTEVQKQDGVIATFLQTFRKSTKVKNEKLVSIVQPHEEKQQKEIDRYQLILDEIKDEENRKENERVDGIKSEIDRVHGILEVVINASTFKALEQDKGTFNESLKTNFDFQEFQFMFDEMVEQKKLEFSNKESQLVKDENLRLENLDRDREAKINQMIVDGQGLIDNIDGSTNEKILKQMVSGIFQTMIDCDVEFDEKSNKKVDQEKEKFLTKVDEKLSFMKQQEINDKRQRIFDIREGLLDIIFQMTIENYVDSNKKIFDAFDQEVITELQVEFDRMKSMVNQSLVAKMATINSQIEKQKEDEIIEEKRMSEVLKQRIEIIEGLGMVGNEDESVWTGFGLEIFIDRIYNDDEIETIVEEIIEYKNLSQSEKDRQELLNDDKKNFILLLNQMKKQFQERKPDSLLDNQEMIDLFNSVRSEFYNFIDDKINQTKEF